MKNRKGNLLIVLGLLLAAAAFGLTLYNIQEQKKAGEAASEALAAIEAQLAHEGMHDVSDPENGADAEDGQPPLYYLYPDMSMPTAKVDGQEYVGKLEIPVLGLELPILSEWSYPGLRSAPCRYQGSVYQCNMIIAAHNYAAHFGNLKYLKQGDQLCFTDMDDNSFVYEVDCLEVLEPAEVEKMESGDWDLTLFTCTIGGAARVTVRCNLLDDQWINREYLEKYV